MNVFIWSNSDFSVQSWSLALGSYLFFFVMETIVRSKIQYLILENENTETIGKGK